MRSHIRKCPECRRFTLEERCESCSVATENTFPPKFSPEDRYGKYRRMAVYQQQGPSEGSHEEE